MKPPTAVTHNEIDTAVVTQDVRQRLLQRLAAARQQTDQLFAALQPATLYQRPIAERHRIVFYIGHLEAFDWNLLAGQQSHAVSLHPAFEKLFAFGIDPVGTALPQDQPEDWPALAQVLQYRDTVRHALDALLAELPMQSPGPWANANQAGFDAACLLSVAIEHRLMHAETLAYLLHRLPLGAFICDDIQSGISQTCPHPQSLSRKEREVKPFSLREKGGDEGSLVVNDAMVDIPAGQVLIGEARSNAAVFAWDNEFEQQMIDVSGFRIDRFMVSNAQYLEFINDGGYDHAAFWNESDWNWKTTHNIDHPGFWRHDGQCWLLRTIFAEILLPPDGPVYVSHAEASAYARWTGKSLPTEAQWLRAAEGIAQKTKHFGDRYAETLGPDLGNFDCCNWDPDPVQTHSNVSRFGVVGLFGNGWEWTSTPFASAEGFEAFPFYRGYSQDFFDGRHFVLKGGSSRTAACLMRPGFRNWFQPHYQHVYAGFRCVTHP